MSEIGELLKLLQGAPERYRTARATARSWVRLDLQERAVALEAGSDSKLLADLAAEQRPEEAVRVQRLWVAPERFREEAQPEEGDLSEGSLEVRTPEGGICSFHHSFGTEALSWPDDRHTGLRRRRIAAMLNPTVLLADYSLEATGEQEMIAGRRGIGGVARPRASLTLLGGPLAIGAEAHHLVVDAKSGVLLKVSAMLEGALFERTELTELAFDENFPKSTWDFQPPVPGPDPDSSPED